MADQTRDVDVTLRLKKEGDAGAFKETAADIAGLAEPTMRSTELVSQFFDLLGKATGGGEDLERIREAMNGVAEAADRFADAKGIDEQLDALNGLEAAWKQAGTAFKSEISSNAEAAKEFEDALSAVTAKQQELTAQLQSSASAAESNATALRASGDNSKWVAEQTAAIMGVTEKATASGLKYGESFAAAAKSTDALGAASNAATGLLTAMLLKLDPVKINIEQLAVAQQTSIGITEKLAEATGIELPESYGKAAAAAGRFVEAIATGRFTKAYEELKSYIGAMREYASDTLVWMDQIAGGGAKVNEQLVDSMKGAREQLQTTMKAQREMTDAREKDLAAMAQQAAVLERQIKAEQASGEVTKQTADAAQDLIDKYQDLGKTAPAGFESAARAAGVLAEATERATSAVEDLGAAAGGEGAAGGIGALSAAVTQVVDPLTDFATKAQTAAEALGKNEFAEPGKGLDQLASSADDAGQSVDQVAQSVDELGSTVDELPEKFEEFRDAATGAFDGVAESAGLVVEQLQAKIPAAMQQFVDNAKRSKDALFGQRPGESRPPADEGPTPGGDRQEAAPRAETRAAQDAAADVAKAMESTTKAIEAATAAGKQFAEETAPAVVQGLNDIVGAAAFGDESGLGSLRAQLEALSTMQFASPILEQLSQIVAGAQEAAAALAAIGDAAGEDAPAATAPSSGPSSFQTGAG